MTTKRADFGSSMIEQDFPSDDELIQMVAKRTRCSVERCRGMDPLALSRGSLAAYVAGVKLHFVQVLPKNSSHFIDRLQFAVNLRMRCSHAELADSWE